MTTTPVPAVPSIDVAQLAAKMTDLLDQFQALVELLCGWPSGRVVVVEDPEAHVWNVTRSAPGAPPP